MKDLNFGLQTYFPTQYIVFKESPVAPISWHVKKLKRAKYIPIHLLIIPLVILWSIFGIYYAYVMHPQAFFAIILLLILGLMASFVFRSD